MKFHDQEIMDILEKQFGEDAVIAYGEALPEHSVPTDAELIMEILNGVLIDIGAKIRLTDFRGVDDDGYFWEVLAMK